MFEFIYKGKFDSLITKETFELYIRTLYADLKKLFRVTWSPKKFIVSMEINTTKPQGWGGNFEFDPTTSGYKLNLQLFGYPKNKQTFAVIDKLFGHTLIHEMLHAFIPYLQNKSCWSEGVVEFMTFWYTDTIRENMARLAIEYKNITDQEYKQHKYGYLTGCKKMAALYFADPSVIEDMRRLIRDFNKDLESKKVQWTAADIVAYNPNFRTFFGGRCNQHIAHELD
jgi:hypothetical protein